MSTKLLLSKQILIALVAATGLVACAEPGGRQEHSQHHASQSANASGASAAGVAGASAAQGGTMGGAMTGSHAGCGMMGGSKAGCPGGMQHMDKEAMCARYRGMRDAPNEEARQAMMDPQMRAMSPDMRMQHMEMMRKHCQ